MDIGEPERITIIEPLEDPVPRRVPDAPPVEQPQEPVRTPETEPALV